MMRKKLMAGSDFAFATGRTGVLQQLLLSQSDIDRLLGARDRKEVEQILTELNLTNMIDQSLSDSESILLALEAWVRKEVTMMTPTAALPTFCILWSMSDAPHLSYMLKEHHELTSALTSPSEGGDTERQGQVRAYIENGDRGTLTEDLTSFIDRVKNMVSPSPQDIDQAVAQYTAEAQSRLARTSGSELIERYVTHLIDLQNVRSALRLSAEDRADSLLEGGSMEPRELLGDTASLAGAIRRSTLPYSFAEQFEAGVEDPIVFERAAADVLSKDITSMWNVPMSGEPVFAFAAIALSNIFLLKAILLGKGNDLSPQEIKTILPPYLPASHYALA